jgi:hypothetical protein
MVSHVGKRPMSMGEANLNLIWILLQTTTDIAQTLMIMMIRIMMMMNIMSSESHGPQQRRLPKRVNLAFWPPNKSPMWLQNWPPALGGLWNLTSLTNYGANRPGDTQQTGNMHQSYATVQSTDTWERVYLSFIFHFSVWKP